MGISLRSELDNVQKQSSEVFGKKGTLRYYTKFTIKDLCQIVLFNKVVSVICNIM